MFHPKILGCPVCNATPNRFSGFSFNAHTPLGENRFRGHICNHEFDLFDALKVGCRGTFGIIGTFAHWQWTGTQKIRVGTFATVDVALPSTITPFAVFLTPNGATGDDPSAGFLPKMFSMKDQKIQITSIGFSSADAGREETLAISISGYSNVNLETWKSIFYEGLTDLSEQRYGMSLFKLVQSLEMACDEIIVRYLVSKLIHTDLIENIFKFGKNWDARRERIKPVASEYLNDKDVAAFSESIDLFYKEIRPIRNAFTHEGLGQVLYKDVNKAYQNCFSLLWWLEKISSSMGKIPLKR